jgi:hypothetical protein
MPLAQDSRAEPLFQTENLLQVEQFISSNGTEHTIMRSGNSVIRPEPYSYNMSWRDIPDFYKGHHDEKGTASIKIMRSCKMDEEMKGVGHKISNSCTLSSAQCIAALPQGNRGLEISIQKRPRPAHCTLLGIWGV